MQAESARVRGRGREENFLAMGISDTSTKILAIISRGNCMLFPLDIVIEELTHSEVSLEIMWYILFMKRKAIRYCIKMI